MTGGSPLLRYAAALRYLRDMDEVEGWTSRAAALAIMELAWAQGPGDGDGMAEVGIHHGRSFLALAACARPGERLFAVDVFERQHLNVDRSGEGDRGRFEANLARFFPGAAVTTVAESSTDLRGREAALGMSGLRLFSVDGGHTSETTSSDLALAEASLAAGGVCALDDVLNRFWTGVLSGLFRYLGEGGGLAPLALVPNKLLLCRPGPRRGEYRELMRGQLGYCLERRDAEFGGHRIDVYGDAWGPLNSTIRALADLG